MELKCIALHGDDGHAIIWLYGPIQAMHPVGTYSLRRDPCVDRRIKWAHS